MNYVEIFKLFLTAFITVLSGATVLALGQILIKFFIEPMHERQKLIGEITDSLIFYAPEWGNPGSGNRMDEASQKFRQQASQLTAKTYAIRGHKLFKWLRIPKYDDALKASKEIIRLSNNIHSGKKEWNEGIVKDICRLLMMRYDF